MGNSMLVLPFAGCKLTGIDTILGQVARNSPTICPKTTIPKVLLTFVWSGPARRINVRFGLSAPFKCGPFIFKWIRTLSFFGANGLHDGVLPDRVTGLLGRLTSHREGRPGFTGGGKQLPC